MATRRKKILSVLLALLIVAAAAAAVFWWRYKATQAEMAEVSAPVVQKDLPVEAIRAQLKSGNFRDKLAAKKQIEKLEPGDRLAVLTVLLGDDDVATRLLAVKALADLGSNEARAKLSEVAAKDADEKVRAAAAEALRPPAPEPAAAEPAAAAAPAEPAAAAPAADPAAPAAPAAEGEAPQ